MICPGETGPQVEAVQRLVGAPVTGVYDDETTAKVRGWQVMLRTSVRDGVFDEELEYGIRRVESRPRA